MPNQTFQRIEKNKGRKQKELKSKQQSLGTLNLCYLRAPLHNTQYRDVQCKILQNFCHIFLEALNDNWLVYYEKLKLNNSTDTQTNW